MNERQEFVQALRQLYVLACEKRIMRAIDINIRQPVYVPVTLAMASEHSAADPGPLDLSRDENRPLNTPANVPPSYRDKGVENAESALQVNRLLFLRLNLACCENFLFGCCVMAHELGG